jgi:hypothetical protein
MGLFGKCKCAQPVIKEGYIPGACFECKKDIEPERLKIEMQAIEDRLKSIPPRERLGEEVSNMIPQSEEILFFTDCGIRSKSSDMNGYVIVTRKSIYLIKWQLKFFGKPPPKTKEVMSIAQITGLDQTYESFATVKSHHVRITRANNEDILYRLSEANASEFINIVNSQNNGANNQGASKIDPVEQLTKLAALLEKGLITKEEFNKKKLELL